MGSKIALHESTHRLTAQPDDLPAVQHEQSVNLLSKAYGHSKFAFEPIYYSSVVAAFHQVCT
jgi:hypothetical protein